MPEGDNVARIADVLGAVLVGREVVAARGRPGGARLERVVGAIVESVEARGKHLLIGFSGGLALHSHLGLTGSWHRYRRGEPWRRPASRAVAVLETDEASCVCFDAPTVELLDSRAVAVHPALAKLGPDVAADDFDAPAAAARARRLAPPDRPLGEVLLDQRIVAGLGNVYRSELPFRARLSPFTPLGSVPDQTFVALLDDAARLVSASHAAGRRVTTAAGVGGRLYVYGRTGRPCLRCATSIRSAVHGAPARRVYWCPRCQPTRETANGF